MKSCLVMFLLVAVSCWSQSTTGKASTSGVCSPAVTGSNNQFRITCEGIGKEQGQTILAILNKILAEHIDLSAVMQKLDDMKQNPPDPNRGVLIPANDPNPFVDDWCEEHPPKGSYRLYLGPHYFLSSTTFPTSAIRIHGKSVVELHPNNSGMTVTATVNSPDGKRIAFMKDNYFKLDDYFREERPDASTLNVFDETRDEPVLHVRYLNPKAILVTGAFSEQGLTVIINDQGIKTAPTTSSFGTGCAVQGQTVFSFF